MGIFDALNTAVGGLQAQSFALQNISGNIANASTTGYKGIGTSFEDLIPDSRRPTGRWPAASPPSRKPRSPPRARCRRRRSPPTWRSTATASSRCRSRPAIVDNVPVFNGVTDYTRRGDFQVNANGNLVNGAGYYLMGVTVDPKTGNPTRQRSEGPAVPEQLHSGAGDHRDQYAANLPTQPPTRPVRGAPPARITALGGLNPSTSAIQSR